MSRHWCRIMIHRTSSPGLERAVGYVLIGSRGQEAQHLHLTFLVVSEYAAVQALMRIIVAVLVIQSAIKLFAVEWLSISRHLKLQIGVLPAFEIAVGCTRAAI